MTTRRQLATKKRGPAGGREIVGYGDLVGGIAAVLEAARRNSARAVNAVMTATYWEVGRRIVEFEQGGKERAEYGAAMLARLSADLTSRYGRGFGVVNLSQMKKFYLLWPADLILQTPSEKSSPTGVPALSQPSGDKSNRHTSVVDADAGQMHTYLSYAAAHWTRSDENPPVGLILCAQKDEALARYALDNLPNKVLAAEYRTVLPDEKVIAADLQKTRRMLEHGGAARPKTPAKPRRKRKKMS